MNFEWIALTPDAVFIRASILILMAGVVLDSAELIGHRRLYARGAIFGGGTKGSDVARTSVTPEVFAGYTRLFDRIAIFDRVVTHRVLLALNGLQFVLAFGFIAFPAFTPYIVAVTICIRLISMARHGAHGSEGADHMVLILLVSTMVYYIAPGALAKRSVLWFIAAQSLLAYFTAGIVKARHSRWTKGSAMRQILSTDLFGNRPLADLFSRRTWLGPLLCWAVIVFECLLPLLVFTGPAGCIAFLCMGLVFHLTIAAIQGLNLFVFAFAASYPALLVTSLDLNGLLVTIHR